MTDRPTGALIVGGGTGMGRAAAERLARRGAHVMISGRRVAVLEEAAAAVRSRVPGAVIAIHPADAGDDVAANALVQAASEEFGGLDVCINCAGIYEPVAITEMDAAAWRRTMSTTLDSVAYVGAAAARVMKAAGAGRMVLISSVNSPVSEPESAHYSAAKAGVSSLARSLALDLAADGVRVNAIAPGWVHTAMVDDFLQTATQESLSRLNMLGRVGEPDEVANVIEYLALDAPDYLTGTTIFVDGGQTAMAPMP